MWKRLTNYEWAWRKWLRSTLRSSSTWPLMLIS